MMSSGRLPLDSSYRKLIGHVRYINILTWLRGFQVKLLYLELFSLYAKKGAFHLVKNSENSGSGLNGKRFFGSPDWKIPRKSGTAQKVVPFSRLERPNGNLCFSSLYQFHAFRGLFKVAEHSFQVPMPNSP